MVFFSCKERMRHWDTAKRGHKRHSLERFSGEKEEWHRERRHRDTSEGRYELHTLNSAIGVTDTHTHTPQKKKKDDRIEM